MTQRLTVTRALTELKTLDKRIDRAIGDTIFISYGGQSQAPAEQVKLAKSRFQQIQDLIKRRRLIKSLLTQSNATTLVTICEQEMTVAEAIEMKSSIKHQKNLRSTLSSQYTNALNSVERENARVRANLEATLRSRRQTEDDGSNHDIETYSASYRKTFGVSLEDPLKVQSKITELQEYITEFESQVDHVLSEKNATTYIELPN